MTVASESECTLQKENALNKAQEPIKYTECAQFKFQKQDEVGMARETIPNLKPYQVKVLNTPRAFDRFYKQYPGLKVSVDKDRKTAEVRAPGDIMNRAFSDVLSFITLMRVMKIPLTPGMVKMCEKEDTEECIQTILIDKHKLVCHLELCDDYLILSGHTSAGLPRLKRMFKSAFKEATAKMQKQV